VSRRPVQQNGPAGNLVAVAVLRLFAAAREAAGVGSAPAEGSTVGAVLEAAERRYGAEFAAVVAGSRVWVNGEPAGPATPVGGDDEVAVLPPVSGG
jgi:molybdopterin synthase sulfur carrier subunit